MTPDPRHQRLRVLEGRFVVSFETSPSPPTAEGLLAHVSGPDGYTTVRRDDEAADAWIVLWSGDEPHSPEAVGMLGAIVSPLAAGGIPIMALSTFHADMVLVPADRSQSAFGLLRDAGHEVRE